MEIGLGHRYKASVDNITIPTSPSAFDLILLAPASNVPIIVDRIVATASVLTGAILRLVLTRRSATSTGGTALVPTPSSPASPSASTGVTYLTTAQGAASGTPLDSQQWNEFAPYEFNVRPAGELIVPGTWLALSIPAVAASTVTASFTVEFIEVK